MLKVFSRALSSARSSRPPLVPRLLRRVPRTAVSVRAMHTVTYGKPVQSCERARAHCCITSDEESLFSMTKYRWLYNNEEQRAVRYVRFNVEALLDLAVRSANAKRCTSLEKIYDDSYVIGTLNRVLGLKFDNDVEYIVKIPFPVTGPKHLCTASEVATLDYLRTELDVSVPKVVSWSSHAERSPLGTEYIMYEKIPGLPLSKFDKTDLIVQDDPYVLILPTIVSVEAKLTVRAFSQIGSLYYKDDVPESLRRDLPLHTASEHCSTNSARFCVGPTVEREFYRAGRSKLDIDRGPWLDNREYMAALGECARAVIDAGLEADPDGVYRDLVSKYAKLLPFIAPPRTTISLWHPDFHSGNIIIDENVDVPTVNGIIDWQGSVVAPYYQQYQVPPAYTFEEDSELVVYQPGYAPIFVDGYEDLSPEEKDRADRHLRYGWRAYMHQAFMGMKDERLTKDLYDQDGSASFLRLATLPSVTITRGSRSLPYIRRSFRLVRDLWNPLVGIDDDDNPITPFPFPLPEADEQEIDEEIERFPQAMSLYRDFLARFDMKPEGEGLVKVENYDEAKKAADVALQAALDSASGPEEREQIAGAWPLQDGKYSHGAERCW
ncbi:kinase-like domain-containing protein [Schizophyllum fasciatum]